MVLGNKTPNRSGSWISLPGIASAGLLTVIGYACPAHAQTPDMPPADQRSIITIQDENASISTARLTDRYYVNGLRLGYVSPTDITPDWMQRFGAAIWGAGRQRIAIDIAQSMFTPADTAVAPPLSRDRPYAGVLLATGTLIQDSSTTRDILSLSLGVLGPGAGASSLQNGFHNSIGQGHDAGWHYQLPNQAVGEVLIQRTWRLPLARFGGLEADVLPAATIAAGNVRTYGQGAALFRLGQGLGSDFGVARVQPGVSGSDAFTPTQSLAWYIFGGGDGQLVANDITLDPGSAPYASHVSMINEVGEMELGMALIWHGVRISYTQVFQTHEFHGQRGGLHQFGSLAASVRF